MRVSTPRILVTLALGAAIASGGAPARCAEPAAGQGGERSVLTIRHRGQAWDFTHHELLALASDELRNHRDNRTKPAIPFEAVLAETGLPLAEIGRVIVLRGEGSPVILRPHHVQYLDRLVLSTGPSLEGQPHSWELAPEDEETYEALHKVMGSRRKHDVQRIDVTLKEDLGS